MSRGYRPVLAQVSGQGLACKASEGLQYYLAFWVWDVKYTNDRGRDTDAVS